ncbi:MAG: hypothetical protein H0W44_01435 [Gammaproteobacteria bacterium]|nr:hypothetical protein [Gammaproteobacteria bacterium]
MDKRSEKYLQYALGFLLAGMVTWAMLSRLQSLEKEIELSGIDQTLSLLRQGLQIYHFRKMLEHAEVLPQNSNPFNALQVAPIHYAGEYASSSDAIPGGQWYFDLSKQYVVYRFKQTDFFHNEKIREWHYKISPQPPAQKTQNEYVPMLVPVVAPVESTGNMPEQVRQLN